MASCGQLVPNEFRQLIFCIIVTRNGLNTKRSLHSRLNFMFLVQLLISLSLAMTCVIPSQNHDISSFVMPVIQLIYSSSVEAYLL